MARPDLDDTELDAGAGQDSGIDYSTPDSNLGIHYNDRPRGSLQFRDGRG